MSDFLVTPKPRELTEKEIDRFDLRCHNKEEVKPVYENTGNVWATADDGKLPTYRFYNCGTNCLMVLKYTPDRDVWEKINLSDVSTLYAIIWLMCLELNKC